jgi:hypothetical protein
VCAAATVVCVLATGSSASSDKQLPLLSGGPSYSVEFDMPKAVQERAIREQRNALAAYRGVTIGEPSRQAGCQPTDFPGSLGPPAPDVSPRVIGYHVVVVVRFKSMPSALACRPQRLSIAISGGSINPQVRAIPWVETYALQGSAGRAVIRFPLYSVAPYKLTLVSETIQGRRSKDVERMLTCPPGGCVAGEAPSQHQRAIRRKFPLHTVSCVSRTVCQATFTDPLFPRDPVRVRYVIGGEQVPTCWAVTDSDSGEPPYEDMPRPTPPAGCVTWPH